MESVLALEVGAAASNIFKSAIMYCKRNNYIKTRLKTHGIKHG